MPDALRRTLRTLIQVAIAAAGTALIAVINGWNITPQHSPSLGDLKGGAVYVVGAVAVAVATYGMNHLEDSGLLPAILKAPPSPGANPVPQDAGGHVPPAPLPPR